MSEQIRPQQIAGCIERCKSGSERRGREIARLRPASYSTVAKTLCNDLAVIALLHEHTCYDRPIAENDIAVFERALLLFLDLRKNERDLRLLLSRSHMPLNHPH